MSSLVELIEGDCLQMMKDIPSKSIDLVLTDPPYGTTACKWDAVIPLKPMWEELNRLVKPDCVCSFTASQPFTTVLISSNRKDFQYCWYWNKNQGTNFYHAKRMPIRKVEEVVIFGKSNKAYKPMMTHGHAPTNSARGSSAESVYYGVNVRNDEGGKTTRYPDSILKFDCVSNYHRLHPSQKPIELMEYLIRTYTDEGDTVLDFAMGSGTTGVACVNTNRNFIGIELDPNFYTTACDRIESA